MPDLKDGELSRRDLGITTAEICPTCLSTEIDVEPAYQDGEITGSLYRCLDCGWHETFNEDSVRDAEEYHSQLEKEIITVDAVTGWLERFKQTAVQELQGASNLEKADQRHLQSKIKTLEQLIEFFEDDTDEGGSD